MRHHGVAWLIAGLGLVLWTKTAAAEPMESPAGPPDGAGGPAAAPNDGAAPQTANPSPQSSEGSDEDGLLGPVSLGGFVGAGFPRPLSVEGFAKIEQVVGFGLEYSVLPKLSLAGTETTFYAIDIDARVFPLKDGFFVGMAVGRQHLAASGLVELPAPLASIPEQITGDTWFINPRIGFLTTFGWGGTIGIDAGVQIPVSTSFNSTLPTGIALSQDVNGVAHFFTKSVLPTVNLLRLGIML